MEDIEIRWVVSAERALAVQANPAVIHGLNGDPDEVIIALEISTLADDGNGTRRTFALPLSALRPTIDALNHADRIAGTLVEDLS